MSQSSPDAPLQYHERPPHGKISVTSTKPLRTVHDLALAYTPGVAEPVKRIAEHADDAYRYTSKGNLVAVVTNGTAILGLGHHGALAAKPVMEGKAVLFRRFAGIDAVDIEIDSIDPEEIIRTVQCIAPTFGGINLEDIRAPECIQIEQGLIERLSIPVFHDDQHGTAVVVAAGLLNALEVAGKKLADTSIVLNGAGSAGLAVARMLLALGCDGERLLLCDSRGVISTDRTDLNAFKKPFARITAKRTLAEAVEEADVFIGVSVANALKQPMLRSMATDPIVFAMANPTPEIDPALARKTRPDAIVATGRSDYPNQVNNLLCFPFLFRGALDVRARSINQEMKIAAIRALAALAKEPVSAAVQEMYGGKTLTFGREYLLPKPFDQRLLPTVAPAVARAAMESGVSRVSVDVKKSTENMRKLAEELAR